MLGPGLTTGAADDDPSGIATYSQTGARWGFSLLWLAAFSFPLMAVIQEMCARIGLVTGRGLAGNIKRYYPKKVLYTVTALLFFANTFNIGADLGAMAKATQLFWPNFSFTVLIFFFTALSLVLQIFTSYKDYAKYLKWLALVLMSYVLTAFFVHLNGREILIHAFLPHLDFFQRPDFFDLRHFRNHHLPLFVFLANLAGSGRGNSAGQNHHKTPPRTKPRTRKLKKCAWTFGRECFFPTWRCFLLF